MSVPPTTTVPPSTTVPPTTTTVVPVHSSDWAGGAPLVAGGLVGVVLAITLVLSHRKGGET